MCNPNLLLPFLNLSPYAQRRTRGDHVRRNRVAEACFLDVLQIRINANSRNGQVDAPPRKQSPQEHARHALIARLIAMEASPSTPAERAESVNLTIDAPDTPEQRNMLHTPPSPSSFASCSTGRTTAPMPSASPPLSPAWEGKRGNEHQPVQARLALSPAGLDRGLPFLIRPPTPTLQPDASPVPANVAGPREFSASNIRPDLMPPGGNTAQDRGAPAAAAAAASALAGTSPRPPPSPAGPLEISDDTSSALARPGFFGSSSTTTPSMRTPVPPSPGSADMSGIFHLDLDSPLAGQATPREDEKVAEDRVQDSAAAEAAAVSPSESSPRQAPAPTSNNASATLSPGLSVPWGSVAPSPHSTEALQGAWGRLQEVSALFRVRPASIFNLCFRKEVP